MASLHHIYMSLSGLQDNKDFTGNRIPFLQCIICGFSYIIEYIIVFHSFAVLFASKSLVYL